MEAGISQPHLSQILTNKSTAGFDNQVQLAQACGYDYISFLEYGRDLQQGRAPELPEPVPRVAEIPGPEWRFVGDSDDRHRSGPWKDLARDFVAVPVLRPEAVLKDLDAQTAGPDDAKGWTLFRVNPGETWKGRRLFAFDVETEGPLPTGSTVVVDRRDSYPVDAALFAVERENLARICRVFREGAHTLLLLYGKPGEGAGRPEILDLRQKAWSRRCLGRVLSYCLRLEP